MNKNLDKCVICHNSTPYSRNLDVSKRSYYIKGVGQLCEKCYHNLYNSSHKHK